MEYLLGTLCCFGMFIGIPLWLWSSAKKQKAIEEYTWHLLNWEHSDDLFDIRVFFPEMKATLHTGGYEWPSTREKREFPVRRRNDGVWEDFSQGTWTPMADDLQPSLETAYQRYIHRT